VPYFTKTFTARQKDKEVDERKVMRQQLCLGNASAYSAAVTSAASHLRIITAHNASLLAPTTPVIPARAQAGRAYIVQGSLIPRRVPHFTKTFTARQKDMDKEVDGVGEEGKDGTDNGHKAATSDRA
jgi:hypothetical protein